MSQKITEIVLFNTLPDVDPEQFAEIVAVLERDFHMPMAGYINSELSRAENGQWLLFMHWETMAHLKKASKAMMESTKTEAFRNCLDVKSVKIQLYQYLTSWDNK